VGDIVSLDVSHWIRGYLYDSSGSPISGATVTVATVTGSDSATNSTTTTVTGYYQLNVQAVCNENDLISVTFTSGADEIVEFIRVNLDDLTQEVSATFQYTFSFNSESYNIRLAEPDYEDASMNLIKATKLTNFYDGQLFVDDVGKEAEPLIITVYAWVDIRNRDTISGLIEALNVISNDGEEVTITGIQACIDGVYVINRIHAEPVENTKDAFQITISLEYVRDD